MKKICSKSDIFDLQIATDPIQFGSGKNEIKKGEAAHELDRAV